MLSIIGKTTPTSNKFDDLKESTCDNGSKFKPANHEQTPENADEWSKINDQQESSNPDSNSEDNKKTSLHKSRSFGTSSWQLRTRWL